MRPRFHLYALLVSDHFFEALECKYLDYIACRFSLEHHFFTGERINALACPGSWLAHDLNLHQARYGVNTRASFQVTLDKSGE